jgi:hypothetical protein
MRKFAISLAAVTLAASVPLSATTFPAVTGNEPTIPSGGGADVDRANNYSYGPDYDGGGFYGRHFYRRPYGFYGRRFYGHRFYGRPYGRDYYWRGYGPW